jgi:hypothetical protein
MMNYTKRYVIVALVGIFLAWIPFTGYALQVEIIAGEGVSKKAVEEAREGITMVELFYQDMYGLDIDYPIRLFLVSDKEQYVSILIQEFGYDRETVEKDLYNFEGLARKSLIVSNIGTSSLGNAGLINIAHELTHQYQYFLGSHKEEQIKWLLEGSADLMAESVIAKNGRGSVNAYAKKRISILRSVPLVPDIAKLHARGTWNTAANTTGVGVNYITADAAVIYLVGKVGFAPIFKFYQIAGEIHDVRQAFNQAFGISIEDFEEEFREYLTNNGVNREEVH